MQAVTVNQITDSLRHLPAEKLVVVYDFVSYLFEREIKATRKRPTTESFDCMLATESVLRRDWDTPEEDAAWADL